MVVAAVGPIVSSKYRAGQVTEFLLRSGAWDHVDTGTGGTGGTVGTPGQP